jgi:hypothetical protein
LSGDPIVWLSELVGKGDYIKSGIQNLSFAMPR